MNIQKKFIFFTAILLSFTCLGVSKSLAWGGYGGYGGYDGYGYGDPSGFLDERGDLEHTTFWSPQTQNFIHERDEARNRRQIPRNTQHEHFHGNNCGHKNSCSSRYTHSSSEFLNTYFQDYSHSNSNYGYNSGYNY